MNLIVLTAVAIVAATPAPSATSLGGLWTNPAHSVTVRIAPCGGAMCGKVVRATPTAIEDARRGTSRLIGSTVMQDFAPAGAGSWSGRLFVADVNQTVDADMRQLDSDHIDIRGCAIGGLLCKSQQWTRVADQRRLRKRR